MAKKDNQTKFFNAYKKSYGNISKACEAAGIERMTYYRWKNSNQKADKAFMARLDNLEPEESFIDFCEGALAGKVSKGDTTAIIFALKTKGKKRGYIERQEVEHGGTIQTQLIKPKADDS